MPVLWNQFLASHLLSGFGMAVISQCAFDRTVYRDGHHTKSVITITVGPSIVGDLCMYREFFSAVSTMDVSPLVGTVDLGFTYGLTPDIQLDAGVNIGVTDSADDVNPFLGISLRF